VTPASKLIYTYLLTGHVETITSSNTGGASVVYSYDNLYRLTGETITDDPAINGSATYTLEAVDNRTMQVASTQAFTSGSTAANPCQTSGTTGSSSANSSTTALTWQHANIWAGGKLLGTYDKDGLHFYFDDPLAGVPTDRSSSVGWFGTRRAQTDAFGVIEQTCSSLPYGDALACSSQPDNATAGPSPYLASLYAPTEHHFTGKERDTESGNDYFEARYYSSTMGRFLSPDWSAKEEPVPYAKLDDPQTLNLYAYVENNPMDRVDADGHQKQDGDQSSDSKSDTNDKTGKVESYLSGKLIDKINDKIGDKVPGYNNTKDAYIFASKLNGEYRELFQWVKLRDKALGFMSDPNRSAEYDYQTAVYNYAQAQADYHAYKLGVDISSIESMAYIGPISRFLGETHNLVTGFPEGQYLRNIEQRRTELRGAFDAYTNEMVRSSPFESIYWKRDPVWGVWNIVGSTYPKRPW
jgi:RHS repeat-associated protein